MTRRAPIGGAILAALVVLAGYLLTLAPTVTFWDAGEFIAAAKTLGIPHPPGTPLFVLLAHVWGAVVPFGAYAWRINLLSAVCGAAGAGCWFLVGHDAVQRLHDDDSDGARRPMAWGGGFAAALLVAFGFTTWQNSTETEVYSAAMLLIAVISLAGAAVARRSRRSPERSPAAR